MPTRSAGSIHLRRFVGDGFTFDYPADATLRDAHNHPDALSDHYLLGPNLTLRADSGNRVRGYSVYALEVTVYKNPEHLAIGQWIHRRLPTASTDSTNASCNESPTSVSEVQVAGQPAVQVEWPGCDGEGTDYYLTDGQRVVRFGYYDSDDELLQQIQHPLYTLVISTLRWTSTGAPSKSPS